MESFMHSDHQFEGSFSHRMLHHWDTVVAMVGRDMKLRYKRSVLGILWTMLNPLAQLVVLGFVFGTIINTKVPHFTSWLFTGLLIWNWFASSLMGCTSSIVDNRDLLGCADFRPAILPVIYVTTYLVHFLLALPILVFVLFFEQVPLSPVLVALPLVIILQFLLTLALGYILATLYVTFRDTQYLLGIVLNLAFFVTPIFYDMSIIPAQYLPIFRANPMAHVVAAYRDIILDGKMPNLFLMPFLYLLSIGLLFLGHSIFRKASHRFVEEI
jgi:lipopolysaccharide transport system permease protein